VAVGHRGGAGRGAAATLVGFDAVTQRVTGDQLVSSANFRGELRAHQLAGARMAFFPWGSGWGTYERRLSALPAGKHRGVRQPRARRLRRDAFSKAASSFLLLAGIFLWLAVRRARTAGRNGSRDALAGTASAWLPPCAGWGYWRCSRTRWVEFNLRIPRQRHPGRAAGGRLPEASLRRRRVP